MDRTDILKSLNENIRIDGRKLLETRKIVVEYGISKNAEGSARVKIGGTEILAGVKLALGEPYPDTPDEGALMVEAELTPMSNPEFETGPPDIQAVEMARVVDRGIKPTHLDSHKHIHSFPAIYQIVCTLAKRFGIAAIRWPFEPKAVSAMPWPLLSEGGRERARLVRIMARINRLQNSNFLKNDVFLGVAHTGKIDVSFFRTVAMYSSAAVAEIMTHPGFVEGMENVRTRLIQQRRVELDALCSEKTKQYIRDAGIKLVHYGQI